MRKNCGTWRPANGTDVSKLIRGWLTEYVRPMEYGPDERFASPAAHRNFNIAVDAVVTATGANIGDAEAMVNAIAAYIMRDYADRAKQI